MSRGSVAAGQERLRHSDAIKTLGQFFGHGHNQSPEYERTPEVPAILRLPSGCIRATGGFRAACQALPLSLVAKLEVLAGGRQPARTCRSELFPVAAVHFADCSRPAIRLSVSIFSGWRSAVQESQRPFAML